MTEATDPVESFDAAQARLEQIAAEARANARGADRAADAAEEVRATARSPRGEVSVTARGGGIIVAVDFGDVAYDLDATSLGRLTVATIAQAQHAAAMRLAEVVSAEFASDPALAASLRADAERAFPSSDAGGVRY